MQIQERVPKREKSGESQVNYLRNLRDCVMLGKFWALEPCSSDETEEPVSDVSHLSSNFSSGTSQAMLSLAGSLKDS